MPAISLLSPRGEKVRSGSTTAAHANRRPGIDVHNRTKTTVATTGNTLSGSNSGVLTGQVLLRIVTFEVELKL